MATTGSPANIPLFGDDDPVTPIQAPINAIAKALNDYLKTIDTGWVNMTAKSGYTASRNLGYRQIGNVVYLRGQIQINTGTITTDTQVTAIPAAKAPNQSTNTVGVGAGSVFFNVVIQTSGSIDVNTPSSASQYVRLDGISYVLS